MTDSNFGSWLRERMLEQRIVVVRGHLDDARAGQAAGELMLLDAERNGPITLHIDCDGGSLDAAFSLIDVMDAIVVPVEVICVGRAEGPAVGVVAAGSRRRGAPHSRFRLAEPTGIHEGRSADIEAWAAHQQHQLARFVERLARDTGRPAEHVEADMAAGRWMDAPTAVDYGLIDELWVEPGRSAPPR